MRHDLGITYDVDVLRLIQEFQAKGLYVGSVVITQYSGQSGADQFKMKLEHGHPYTATTVLKDIQSRVISADRKR